VTIIIWGATAKLVDESPKIQGLIKKDQGEGLHISACKSCPDQLGVAKSLENLEIEMIYWREPLANILKNDEKLITI